MQAYRLLITLFALLMIGSGVADRTVLGKAMSTSGRQAGTQPGRGGEGQTDAAVNQGYNQLKQGLAEQAIATFTRVLARDPNNLKAQLGLALSQQKAGRTAKAIVEFQKALALDPTNQEALKQLGVLYSYQRQTWPQSVEALQTYLEINPSDAEARLLLGQVLSWRGEHAAAEQHLRRIVEQQPEAAEAKVSLAQVLTWQGKGQVALPIFEELRRQNKFPKAARHDYALALRQTGNYEAAEKFYLQLIMEDPKSQELKMELAQLMNERERGKQIQATGGQYTAEQLETLRDARQLHESGKTEDAIPLYRRVLAQRPGDDKLQLEFVDILASSAVHRDEALRMVEELYKKNPSRQLQLQRAKILSWMPERRSEAMAVYREYYRRNPADEEIRKYLVQIVTWAEADPSLASLYTDLLKYEPDNELLNLRLAQAYIKQENFAAALPVLESILRKNPDNFDARIALAGAYIGLKRNEDAEAQLRLLLQIDPRNVEVLAGIASIEAQAGDTEKAIETYNRVLQVAPNHPQALVGLSGIYQSLGRSLEALPLLERAYGASKDPKVGLELVKLYRRLNRNDKALKVLDEINPRARDLPATPEPSELSSPITSSPTPPTGDSNKVSNPVPPPTPATTRKAVPAPPQGKTPDPLPEPPQQGAGRRSTKPAMQSDPDDIRRSIQSEIAPEFKIRYEAVQRSGEEIVAFNDIPENQTSIGAVLTNRIVLSYEVSPSPQMRLGFDVEPTFLSTGNPILLATGQPRDFAGPGFNGVAGRVRMNFQPTERVRLTASAGFTPVSDPVGEFKAAFQVSDAVQLRFEGGRQAITESLLSYTGFHAFGGGGAPLFGRVRSLGGGAGVGFRLDPLTDLNLKVRYDLYSADNLPNNNRRYAEVNFGRDLALPQFDYFRIGYQLTYFGFERDQSTIPVDGGPSGTLLVRGYFSPGSYFNNGVRIDVGGSYKRLTYHVGGGIGVQTARARPSRFLQPGTTAGAQLMVELLYKFSDRFLWGFDYEFNNAGANFSSNRVGTTVMYKF